MYATLFRIDLSAISSSHERARAGRSLAKSLGALSGFVAFIAVDAGDGDVSGLCICEDPATLEEAQQLAARWQGEHSVPRNADIQPISTGKVIVQQGL